jgi:hypothetical protein
MAQKFEIDIDSDEYRALPLFFRNWLRPEGTPEIVEGLSPERQAEKDAEALSEARYAAQKKTWRVFGSFKMQPSEADIERARDPDVRAATHAACRHITGLDADLATERNQEGWSGSTSAYGHRLSALPELDADHAACAIKLLRKHPRQIPADLYVRIYGRAFRC